MEEKTVSCNSAESECTNYMTYPEGYFKFADTLTFISENAAEREAFMMNFAKTLLKR